MCLSASAAQKALGTIARIPPRLPTKEDASPPVNRAIIWVSMLREPNDLITLFYKHSFFSPSVADIIFGAIPASYDLESVLNHFFTVF